jgi:hypothetical protein
MKVIPEVNSIDMEGIDGKAILWGWFFFFVLIVWLVVSGFILICHWAIFSKAGKPGWAILVPIYNLIVVFNIAGRPAVWMLWFFQVGFFALIFLLIHNVTTGVLFGLSFASSLFFRIRVIHSLAKSFRKGAGFTVGLIFLPFIFYPILAYGSAKYIGPGGKPADNKPQV